MKRTTFTTTFFTTKAQRQQQRGMIPQGIKATWVR